MSSRASAAIGMWRGRNVRAAGERAYRAYLVILVAAVTAVPVARAVWLSATSTDGISAFTSPHAPAVTMLAVAALWACALLLGRDRGPALWPPFLTHAFATNDLPQSATFRGPLVRAGTLVTTLTTLVCGVIGGSLLSAGLVELSGAMVFITAGAFVGIVATIAWLVGQTFPRAAVLLAFGIFAMGVTTAAFPAIQMFTPVGWVGLVYPGLGTPHLLAPLIALTLALVAAVPALMNRLDLANLLAQAVRWDSATTNATAMDFGAAAATYQRQPHLGRRLRAVRPLGIRAVVFLVRDAIGAVRTPGRLIVGILAVVVAGSLITVAFAPGTPGWALGAAAGIILFAGLGPLTDGLRHAAQIAVDIPIYGFSDELVLAYHAIFPLIATVIVLLATVVTCSLLIGNGATVPIVSSLTLGVLALTARISNTLKGPMPPTLLTPIPTPMGDLGAAVRLAWAFDGVLFAALIGASIALAPQSPLLLIAVAVGLIGVGTHRWRHRA